jgi:hypothetical protein
VHRTVSAYVLKKARLTRTSGAGNFSSIVPARDFMFRTAE